MHQAVLLMSCCAAVTFDVEGAHRAARRIRPFINDTPLVCSRMDPRHRLFLKCEHLQVTGSFKFRGALNALLTLKEQDPVSWRYVVKHGVIVGSTGNLAIATANVCKRLGLEFSAVVHDRVSPRKIDSLRMLHSNVRLHTLSVEAWYEVMMTSRTPFSSAYYLSGVDNHDFILGNATIGLELLAARPTVQLGTVVIPYGGGGLVCGLGGVLKACASAIRVVTAESTCSAPFFESYRASTPVATNYQPSFVDGIGAHVVIPHVFEKAQALVDASRRASLTGISRALGLLWNKDGLFVEGAAATAAAVALSEPHSDQATVCLLSGANINPLTWCNVIQSTTDNKSKGKPQ